MFVLKTTHNRTKDALAAVQLELTMEKLSCENLDKAYTDLIKDLQDEDHIIIKFIKYRIAPVFEGRMRSRAWMKKNGHIKPVQTN